jgi:hypothetical protein
MGAATQRGVVEIHRTIRPECRFHGHHTYVIHQISLQRARDGPERRRQGLDVPMWTLAPIGERASVMKNRNAPQQRPAFRRYVTHLAILR